MLIFENPFRARLKRTGFTLIEVLVASMVMLILGIVVATVFIQSTKSLGQTEGRIELVQAARIAVNRLQPVFSSGAYVPGSAGGDSALIYPDPFPVSSAVPFYNERGGEIVSDDPRTWHHYAIMQTTEDSLAVGFNPNLIHELPTLTSEEIAEEIKGYRSDAQKIHCYIIWWEGTAGDSNSLDILPDEEKVLVIGRIEDEFLPDDTDKEYPVLRSREWAGGYDYSSNNPFEDLQKDATGKLNIRILARGLEEVTFLKRTSPGIQASVLTKKRIISQVGSEDKEFRYDTLLQIPSEISI